MFNKFIYWNNIIEVFITKGGVKYHLNRYCVKNYDYETVSLEEAKKRHKSLCLKCKSGRFKNKNYPKSEQIKKENLINDSCADDIIYNNSVIKQNENSEEDCKLEGENNNTLKNIIFQLDNKSFKNSMNMSKNNYEINIDNKEINNISDNDDNDSENEKKIKKNININSGYIREKENFENNNINTDKIILGGKKIINKSELIDNIDIIKNSFNLKEDCKEEDSSSGSINLSNIIINKQKCSFSIKDLKNLV